MKSTSIALICTLCEALATAVEAAAGSKLTALAPDLAALRKDVALLAEAWSTMAIRNLLNDILRRVKKLGAQHLTPGTTWVSGTTSNQSMIGTQRKLHPKAAEVKKLAGILERCIAAEAPDYGRLNGRYDQVLCLGYKVKSVGGEYTGKTDDVTDMREKCEDLKAAIRAAHLLASGYADRSILKIFMAPEFFFRGRNGAYEHAVVHGVEGRTYEVVDPQTGVQRRQREEKQPGIMEIMSQEIDDEKYSDWLFVLGTAIAATKLTDTEAMVENVALIKKEKESHVVTKELVSHIDFVSNKRVGMGGHRAMKDEVILDVSGRSDVTRSRTRLRVQKTPQPSNYKSADPKPSRFQDERMGGCIFTIDGITIGMEVCLDHGASSTSRTAGRLEHAGNIQIQLIPSGGMSIKQLRTVEGGVVFNVDGMTPHVQVIAGSTPTGVMSHNRMGDWMVNGVTWNDLKSIGFEVDPIRALGTSRWYKPTTLNHIAPAGRGSVVMFGPYSIPQV